MKRFILIIVTHLLVAAPLLSQVEVASFYFTPGKSEFTEKSISELDSFAIRYNKKYIQIIEINGFVEDPDTKHAKQISSARIDSFVERFGLEEEIITINNFATRHERVVFDVSGWDRIDVYYHQDDLEIDFNDEDKRKQYEDSLRKRWMETHKDEKKPVEEVTFEAPQVLPIKFKGSSNKVMPESLPYLDAIVDTMLNNSFLTAHIRGHVCCGNNMRISKKRAKAVYKYLIKHGVESHRLSYKGYSNTMPLVFPEKTNADRAKNRRVEIIFTNSSPEKIIVDD